MRPTIFAASAALLCLFAPAAHAHDEAVSTSEVQISARMVTWKVDVGIAGLGKVVPLPAAEGALADAGVLAVRAPVCRCLASGLSLWIDGKPSPVDCGALEPRYEGGTEKPSL